MGLLALGLGLVTIVVGAELFTNGVEWLGRRLGLAEGAVGGVLAAVGTALPETVIPLVAILMAGSAAGAAGTEIGVGAILGSPFMIATLAMFMTGLGVIFWRRRRASGLLMTVDRSALAVDVRYFFVAYAIALSAALLPADLGAVRYLAAGASLIVYGAYVRRHLTADAQPGDEGGVELTPLRLGRLDVRHYRAGPAAPRTGTIVLQAAVALALIIGGAIVFVDAVQALSLGLGVPPALLALLIAPVATELPETLNSLIWVRQNKDTLAMANLTGALVFQASIPTAVGITLASEAWVLTSENVLWFASAAMAFASVAAIFLVAGGTALTGRRLLVGGAFYAGFLVLVASSVVAV